MRNLQADDLRAKRLVRNEAIRQRNKQRNAEIERQPPHKPMITIVMSPNGNKCNHPAYYEVDK